MKTDTDETQQGVGHSAASWKPSARPSMLKLMEQAYLTIERAKASGMSHKNILTELRKVGFIGTTSTYQANLAKIRAKRRTERTE